MPTVAARSGEWRVIFLHKSKRALPIVLWRAGCAAAGLPASVIAAPAVVLERLKTGEREGGRNPEDFD